MFEDRKKKIEELEKERNGKVLLYITGDRQGLAAQIHQEVLGFFVDHLDTMTEKSSIPKIILYIYTRGGQTIAAWSLVNLLKQFCDELEVIIPYKAHSSGTIICLGADNIIMTKQAQLSPIDPSFNGPLNPSIPGQPPQNTLPVSVEAINGFINLARNDLKIEDKNNLTHILELLAKNVHPLVLGETYRVRNQIKMLAERLLSSQGNISEKDIKRIVKFLTADSGSHDYTINRKEAKELGLPVDTPTDKEYDIIHTIYNDIREELQLNDPYNPNLMIGTSNEAAYSLTQALIESLDYGSHIFVREGTLKRLTGKDQFNNPKIIVNDQLAFQGWRYVKS